MKPIQKLEEGGLAPKVNRKINEIIEALPSLHVLPSADVQVDSTAGGQFLRIRGGAGSPSSDSSNNPPTWG